MKAFASPLETGTSTIRREVTGRRVPASGVSRNWIVYVGVEKDEDGLGADVDGFYRKNY